MVVSDHRTITRWRITGSAAGFGLANRDGTTHPLNVLQVIDGRLLIGFVAEINESESALATGLPVERQRAFAHFAVLTEKVNQILPLSVPGEISNKDRQKKDWFNTLTIAHKRIRAGASGGWINPGIASSQTSAMKAEFHRRPFIRAKLSRIESRLKRVGALQ